MVRLADARFGAPDGESRDLVHSECGQISNPILCCSACLRPIEHGTLVSSEALAKEKS
jgi:hypothetical protein